MNALQNAVSGDNTTTHVVMASVGGGAFSTIAAWVISLFGVVVPGNVEAAIGVLATIAASWAAQKLMA